MVQAHFRSGVGVDEVNSVVRQDLAAWEASVPSSGASLIGLLRQDRTRDPVWLLAVAAFGRARLTVSIAVDGAGLISELQLGPYLSSWAQIDRELAALAPQASLLAARVSPGGRCTPVHQVAASAARPLAAAHYDWHMPLAKDLVEWTDWDVAAYPFGRSLALFEGQNFHADAKGVFWTDDNLGNGLHDALLALVTAGILERREEPDEQFRWHRR